MLMPNFDSINFDFTDKSDSGGSTKQHEKEADFQRVERELYDERARAMT